MIFHCHSKNSFSRQDKMADSQFQDASHITSSSLAQAFVKQSKRLETIKKVKKNLKLSFILLHL